MRIAQFLVDKNGSGIIAMITNNSFIDGITQRLMRKSLLASFDKIYIYDLHGSLKRREKTLEGSKDENVFDIQQGVSINIFIKKEKPAEPEKDVFHFDSLGLREIKYKSLLENEIKDIEWAKIKPVAPNWFFVPKDMTGTELYNNGFNMTDLFIDYGNGIKFRKDNLLVKFMYCEDDVRQMLFDINNMSDKNIYEKYNFDRTPDWDLSEKRHLFIEKDFNSIIPIEYRQFDNRYTYYPLKTINQIIVRGDSRKNLMQHYINGSNVGLIIGRQGQVVGNMPWSMVFISSHPTDMNIFYRGGGINFPLYSYDPENTSNLFEGAPVKKSNLNTEIVKQIADGVGLQFVSEKDQLNIDSEFTSIDILDYIYAVLHSPKYREKYKEFLKIDFPRVPYPKDKDTFWQLVKLGGELRQIHLLESPAVDNFITRYPVDGSNIVEKVTFEIYNYDTEIPDENGVCHYPDYLGAVCINDHQYFADVPLSAWNFYIGGYQPAQKWLKDRRTRTLSFDDILHYQKIIVALTETARIMKEIDKVWIE